MIHKHVLLIALLLFTGLSFAQKQIESYKSSNSELVRALNTSRLLAENGEGYLSVRIFKLDNGSGSAGLPEGHEVDHNLLVAVSEYDEYPRQSLHNVGPFFNPEFLKWVEINNNSKKFVIEHGPFDNRKTALLNVDIENLEIKLGQ